ncbi:NAD(P)H-hydrate dehydratase [Amphibacillus sp. Q70]|uniref:NAD(P)H-hydrate dehydratase n=1 Tax=Amphibacillus sp. Q70 TaxID=3453416 RepID=UPI003F832D6F
MNSVTAKEMYEIDRKAIEDYQISGVMLMENAGRAITDRLLEKITEETKIVILVGGGNNGGDGFVIARTLINLGFQVEVIQVVSNQQIKGDAAKHKAILSHFDCPINWIEQSKRYQQLIQEADLIIDAMLGIGFKGTLKEPYDSIVQQVNQANGQVIAVDLPSGVPAEADIEEVMAIDADLTYCIEAPKPSAFIECYADYYGEWEVVKIGLPAALIEASTIEVWTIDKVNQTLPRRAKHSHKGNHGKGLIIGGTEDMPGAIRLTANAALRSGVGLLTVATAREVIPIIAGGVTEATYMNLTDEETDLLERFAAFDAIAIGMGMGRSVQAENIIETIIKSDKLLIIDADGLYYVREHLTKLADRQAPTILTPHPGEMAMLIDQPIDQIKANPFEIAKDFATKYQLHLVLKGTYTIVTDPNGNQTINMTGNPALAKGGSGDCLAGIILAQVMQKQSLKCSLANACFIHGLAADIAIRDHHTTIDFLATDLIDFLPEAFRTCLI